MLSNLHLFQISHTSNVHRPCIDGVNGNLCLCHLEQKKKKKKATMCAAGFRWKIISLTNTHPAQTPKWEKLGEEWGFFFPSSFEKGAQELFWKRDRFLWIHRYDLDCSHFLCEQHTHLFASRWAQNKVPWGSCTLKKNLKSCDLMTIIFWVNQHCLLKMPAGYLFTNVIHIAVDFWLLFKSPLSSLIENWKLLSLFC